MAAEIGWPLAASGLRATIMEVRVRVKVRANLTPTPAPTQP